MNPNNHQSDFKNQIAFAHSGGFVSAETSKSKQTRDPKTTTIFSQTVSSHAFGWLRQCANPKYETNTLPPKNTHKWLRRKNNCIHWFSGFRQCGNPNSKTNTRDPPTTTIITLENKLQPLIMVASSARELQKQNKRETPKTIRMNNAICSHSFWWFRQCGNTQKENKHEPP